jgi:hypothetical protein
MRYTTLQKKWKEPLSVAIITCIDRRKKAPLDDHI